RSHAALAHPSEREHLTSESSGFGQRLLARGGSVRPVDFQTSPTAATCAVRGKLPTGAALVV
ncbi:MAG: hypothetical protein KC457_34380, partial [Myxococcales bacterium]|nr:hypothetical protein [Myxococcales bacterium]